MSRQKGKNKKRQRSWHRGDSEDIRWRKAFESLPKTEAIPDIKLGVPQKLRYGPGAQLRGDTA